MFVLVRGGPPQQQVLLEAPSLPQQAALSLDLGSQRIPGADQGLVDDVDRAIVRWRREQPRGDQVLN